MSSKEQPHSQARAASNYRPPQSGVQGLNNFDQQTEAALIVQRTRLNTSALTPSDFLQFQRTIGNQAVGGLLSGIAPLQTQKRVLSPSGGVIQTKGNLDRQQKPEIDPAGATEVDIGKWASTKGDPLYSFGYAGCLAIVINDPEQDAGALAHVFDNEVRNQGGQAAGAGLIKTMAEAMIAAIGKPPEKLECLIWAGIGLNGAMPNAYDKDKFINVDYTTGLRSIKWDRFIDASQKQQTPGYGSAILYDPKSAICYTGNVKIALSSKGGNSWGIKIPDYGASKEKPAPAAPSEENPVASEDIFGDLVPFSKEEKAAEKAGPVINPITKAHRIKMGTLLITKANEYLRKTGDHEKFVAFCKLLANWFQGGTESPYIFMANWKREIPQ